MHLSCPLCLSSYSSVDFSGPLHPTCAPNLLMKAECEHRDQLPGLRDEAIHSELQTGSDLPRHGVRQRL